MKGSVRPHARGYWVIDWYHNGKHERFYWSLEEAQIHGQWSKVDTLKEFYGKYDLERIRGLQKRMVIPMKKREKK